MKQGETRDQTILPPTVILGEQERVIFIVGDVGLCGNHISPEGEGRGRGADLPSSSLIKEKHLFQTAISRELCD